MINFNFKPGNELEKEGRDNIPAPEDEIVCPNCHRTLKKDDILPYKTCSCGYHFRMGARERLAFIADEGSFYELFADIRSADPLSFPGYQEKLRKAEAVSGGNESGDNEYTPEDIVIDYIESIKFESVKNDLIAAVADEGEPAIDVVFDLNGFNWNSDTIKFSVSIKGGKAYDTGFWNNDTLQRKVTAGKVDVTVTGEFTEKPEGGVTAGSGDGETPIATFKATSYHIVGKGSVTDAIYGSHTLDVDISDDFEAVISMMAISEDNSPQGATFRLDSIDFSLPRAGEGVSIKMDGSSSPIDYEKVLATVDSTTGTK